MVPFCRRSAGSRRSTRRQSDASRAFAMAGAGRFSICVRASAMRSLTDGAALVVVGAVLVWVAMEFRSTGTETPASIVPAPARLTELDKGSCGGGDKAKG